MAVNLEHLRVLLEVARAPTFAAAAQRMHVTPSAVSQQMKTLETSLGTILFEKSGRGLRLTSEAAELIGQLRPLVDQIDDRVADFTGATDAVRGTVTLGGPDAFCRMWLVPRIPALALRHPELALDVRYAKNDVIEHALASGELDLAVLVAPPESTGIETAPLYREQLVAVASPEYLARHGEPASASELEAHRFVIFDPRARMQEVWLRGVVGRATSFRGQIVCTVRDLTQILELATAGVGIGVVPNHLAEPAVAAGELRVVTLGDRDATPKKGAANVIFLAWRKTKREAARTRAVREALLEGARQEGS
jgi:DNA-binding transcriptional LysR family regulator